MNRSIRLSIVALVVSLLSAGGIVACGGTAKPVNLPAPVESTSLGVGDEFAMQIIGEEKLPSTYVVAPDAYLEADVYPSIAHQRRETRIHLRRQLLNRGRQRVGSDNHLELTQPGGVQGGYEFERVAVCQGNARSRREIQHGVPGRHPRQQCRTTDVAACRRGYPRAG